MLYDFESKFCKIIIPKLTKKDRRHTLSEKLGYNVSIKHSPMVQHLSGYLCSRGLD